jgi:hypothetical protein
MAEAVLLDHHALVDLTVRPEVSKGEQRKPAAV